MQNIGRTEQRKYPRAKVQRKAWHRIIHARDPKRITRRIQAAAGNISGGGAMLEVKELETEGLHISFNVEAKKRNWLAVEIELLLGKPLIQALSKVIWYQKSASSAECNYYVGIEFKDIREEDRKIVLDYVNKSPIQG
jgi:c-di-GMP-binding flagellar brake protein YcgR